MQRTGSEVLVDKYLQHSCSHCPASRLPNGTHWVRAALSRQHNINEFNGWVRYYVGYNMVDDPTIAERLAPLCSQLMNLACPLTYDGNLGPGMTCMGLL